MAKRVSSKTGKSGTTSKSKTTATKRSQPKKPKTAAPSPKATSSTDTHRDIYLSDLVQIVAVAKDHDKSDQLEALAKADDTKVRMPLDTINAIKVFVDGHQGMRESIIGQRILARPGDPAPPGGCSLGFGCGG